MGQVPPTPPSTELFAADLFADDTVLVTGGGTGIGTYLALGFANHGADVAIASREMDHLEPVAEQIEAAGQRAFAHTVDVRDREDVDAMVEATVEELGEITVLVNNAGANFLCPAERLSENGWRAVVGTILDGTANCTFAVGERMIENGGGTIISMGATNSEWGAPYHAHSGAGKAGIENLMKSVAAEWAEHGIRANTVSPGIIETEALSAVWDEAGRDRERIGREIAVDRLGTPDDCVPITLFLASDAAAYVTGATFVVDGGQLVANAGHLGT